MSFERLRERYNTLKKYSFEGYLSAELTDTLKDIYEISAGILYDLDSVELNSQIQGKEYFAFEKGGKKSRAIRHGLYKNDQKKISKFFRSMHGGFFAGIGSEELTSAVYTIAISFCACIDLFKIRDQKTPGTFFEIFIGSLFARRINKAPIKSLEILNLDMSTSLPTDFIFDLGANKIKFHVPVKTSTRERVIQVWAHQRVLDGVYGWGRFNGILIVMSETKTDSKNNSVIEICLPDQWRLYQMFISQMQRVYYLDLPDKYRKLNDVFPKIKVAPFGEFFHETDNLIK